MVGFLLYEHPFPLVAHFYLDFPPIHIALEKGQSGENRQKSEEIGVGIAHFAIHN